MAGKVVFVLAALIAASQPAHAKPVSGSELDEPTPEYLAVGLGPSSLDGMAVSFEIGREFHRQVSWFDRFDFVINDHGDVPTYENVTQLVLVAGARWMMFPRVPDTLLQLAGVYVRAGFALEVRPTLGAPGFSFALGYLPLQGRHWALGAEARADAGLPDSSHDPLTGTLVFELTN